MRVIAGEARGRRLEALPGTDITRPTLDQVKEAMFSIVQFDLPGARVLDLYAGSGQLGIEALSRGAARCVFLDENREAVNIVMKNCKNCGVFDRSRVNIGEAARFLSACREQFDLVLLDPPFHNGTLENILPIVDKCVAPGGIVICESETGEDGIWLNAAGEQSQIVPARDGLAPKLAELSYNADNETWSFRITIASGEDVAAEAAMTVKRIGS